MDRELFGGTDKGLVRSTNQDNYKGEVLSTTLSFAVLCDGMGGENGGNIASELATEFASQVLTRDLSLDMSELSIRAVFSSIISGANAKIFEASQKDPLLKGMGTTMILAVIKEKELFVASVGDSRAYVLGKEPQQITKDHTVVQIMIDKGELSPVEALSHPKRHFITRAVGVGDTVELDFFVHCLHPEDVVLLCSDGLYGYLKKDTLDQLLPSVLEAKSVNLLIDFAKQGGGSDNITAVIMR